MKITIESTAKLVELRTPHGTVRARIWEGHTASGIPVHCYITRVAVANDRDHAEFERELQEHAAPSAEIAAIPLRLLLP